MFQSLIVDGDGEYTSWMDGVSNIGYTWPDYFWDHHQESNYYDDPAKDVPGQQETFEWADGTSWK